MMKNIIRSLVWCFAIITSIHWSNAAEAYYYPNISCLKETGDLIYSPKIIENLEQLQRETPSCIWHNLKQEDHTNWVLKLQFYQKYLKEEAVTPSSGLDKWQRVVSNLGKHMSDFRCSTYVPKQEISIESQLSRRCQEDAILSTIMADSLGHKQENMPADVSCNNNVPNCVVMLNVARKEHATFLQQTVFSSYKSLQTLLKEIPELQEEVFYLTQHSDKSIPFQNQALEFLKRAADEGLYTSKRIAYLTDRILIKSNKMQRYGTQYKCLNGVAVLLFPLESEEELSKLRLWAGLAPLQKTLQTQSSHCQG